MSKNSGKGGWGLGVTAFITLTRRDRKFSIFLCFIHTASVSSFPRNTRPNEVPPFAAGRSIEARNILITNRLRNTQS